MDDNLGAAADREDDHQADGEDAVKAKQKPDFEPTEDELVLHFLRPQLRGFPTRVPGAVVEADPCAAAPWELLPRHGLRDEGYFFAARRRRRKVRRTPAGGGGTWMHSLTKEDGRSVTETMGVVARWSRTTYCFYVVDGEEGRRSTGWMMSEYEITDPRCYRRDDEGEEDDYWVLCHIRRSSRTTGGKPASRKLLPV